AAAAMTRRWRTWSNRSPMRTSPIWRITWRDRSSAKTSKLDHVRARERDLFGDNGGPGLGTVEGRLELPEGVLGENDVDRHDHLVAALGGARPGTDPHALRGGAGDDDGRDAALLQALLERRAKELVRAALDHPFAILRREARDHISRRRTAAADQRVEHH